MADYNIVLSMDKIALELNRTIEESLGRLLGLGYELTQKSINVIFSPERMLTSEFGVIKSDLGFWRITADKVKLKVPENDFYYLVKDEIKFYPLIKLKIDSPLDISLIFSFDGDSYKDVHYKLYGILIDAKVYNKVVNDNDSVQLNINYTGKLFYMVLDTDIKLLNSALYISQYNGITKKSLDTCLCMTDNILIDNH